MNLSVVIRTFNEQRYLLALLNSISAQNYRSEIEMVVVDSGSTDDTVDIARAFGCTILNIAKREFSFGRALNLGCQAATGEAIAIISGHCVPSHNDWLEWLIKPFENDTTGITYGRQIGGPETKFSEHSHFAKYYPDDSKPSQNEFFCNNANSAIRKSLWELYRYDETLTGLEDMHLSSRAYRDGWRVEYSYKACVHHYHHESWRQITRRFEREALALRNIMPELHVTATDAIRYGQAAIWADLRRALAQKCVVRNLPSILMFRICQYYGTWKGYRIHREITREAKEKYFYPN